MSSIEIPIGTLDFTMCGHKLREGCYVCCYRCNYDRHVCPGCGKPLAHGIECCEECYRLPNVFIDAELPGMWEWSDFTGGETDA